MFGEKDLVFKKIHGKLDNTELLMTANTLELLKKFIMNITNNKAKNFFYEDIGNYHQIAQYNFSYENKMYILSFNIENMGKKLIFNLLTVCEDYDDGSLKSKTFSM